MPSTYPDPGTILLDGVQYPLVGETLLVQDLGVWQPRLTIGNPSLESQLHRSTWAISDLTGGHGVTEHFTDATANRYRYSTFDVTRPLIWTQRPAVATENGTAGAFTPLGTLLVAGTIQMYGAFGLDIHLWNESTDSWTDTADNLAVAPVGDGVAFQGTGGTNFLYIPHGTGWDRYDGSTVTTSTSPDFKAFAVLGQMLIGLETTGQFHYSTDGTNFVSFDTTYGRIPGHTTVKTMITYRDATDNPVIVVSTTGHVYLFDPAGPTVYEQDLWYPIHPDQGLAAAEWRGVYHVSNGMGMHLWNSATGSIDSMGLDRDDGLPWLYSHNCKIVHLCPAYNELYALVQGSTGDSTLSSVQKWTGTGWHSVWEASGTGTVTRLCTSQANGTYRIWWGMGNSSYTIELPLAFSNPKFINLNTTNNGLASGTAYLETGLTDMGMPGFLKIAHSALLRFAVPQDDASNSAQPVLKYRTREGADWETVTERSDFVWAASGGILEYITLAFAFTDPDTGDLSGIPFHEIELRLEHASQYIIFKWLTMDFIPVPRKNNAWTVTLDLSNSHDARGTRTLTDLLADLIDSDRIIEMVHRSDTYNVRVASWNGTDVTGLGEGRASRTVQLIETRFPFTTDGEAL